MSTLEPLLPGCTYHIYNRGNNGETLFREPENYRFFLERYIHHLQPLAETYAYCLLPNHFHFLVRIRTDEERSSAESRELFGKQAELEPSLGFRNLFTSYAMAFNRRYERTGSLFEKPFRRKRVENEAYFARLVVYIHRNPQRHGLTADFREWPWSSYTAVSGTSTTRVPRAEVLDWFGGRAAFQAAHARSADDEAFDF